MSKRTVLSEVGGSVCVQALDRNQRAIESWHEQASYGGDMFEPCPEPDSFYFVALEFRDGRRYSHPVEFSSESAAERLSEKIAANDAVDLEVWAEEEPAYGTLAWGRGDNEWRLFDEAERSVRFG
ncbi:hypothetical protein [Neptuniibacter sp. QD37_11]|uniref:hypothetical protein n=1 Tax=Neptuniibacter sp. QD37_11 TaxID=3398209 RepID=UPI0039F4766E